MTKDNEPRTTGQLTKEEFDDILDKLTVLLPPHLEAREISAIITGIFGIYNVPPTKAIIMMDHLLSIYLEHLETPSSKKVH